MKHNFKQTKKQENYFGTDVLELLELNLPKYNSDIAKQIASNVKLSGATSILDFGAGTGTIAAILLNTDGIKVDCVEIDKNLMSKLQRNGFLTFSNLSEIRNNYEFVYSSNVLEHISNDELALKEIYNALSWNGVLLLYLPAFPILFSAFDARIGHYRRYRKKALVDKVLEAGFTVEYCEYRDSLGFFIALISKYLFKLINSSKLPRQAFSFYDGLLYPVSKVIDKLGCKHLFGKNLILLGVKK